MAKENRTELRRRVLKDGRILLPGSWVTYECSIRDSTPKGAKFRLASDTLQLPETFDLVFVVEGLAYPSQRKWRRGADYGVEFIGPPRKVTARYK